MHLVASVCPPVRLVVCLCSPTWTAITLKFGSGALADAVDQLLIHDYTDIINYL